jgi:signal transduction histidine kinase
MPAPRHDLWWVVAAACVAAAVMVMALAWRISPTLARLGVPIGYIVVASLLRASAGGSASGFAGLFLLPVIWLALSASRAELFGGILAMIGAQATPILLVGKPEYPSSSWRAVVVLVSVATVAGLTIQRLVAEARRHANDAVRRAQDLEAANRLLDEQARIRADFIALAAHELRTPVSTILGFASTLEQRHELLSVTQRAEFRSLLLGEARRMVDLVEQLLDLSRLDASAISINPRLVSVSDEIRRAVGAVGGEHAHAIEVDTPNELVATMDTEAFERILSNLVSNALRYGSAPIGVSARAEGEALVVVVTDHGPGVPSEFIPDLFQRFTRSDAGRQRAPGTGLGLAIARSYADAHGGTLTYTGSEREGARFVLRLPRFGASTGHAAPLAQLAPASVS